MFESLITAGRSGSVLLRAEPANTMFEFKFNAIGTSWQIDTSVELSATIRERILVRIEGFDVTYSRFRPDSLVRQIANSPHGGIFAFPGDAEPLFDLYDRLHAATAGAVDPLVGRALELLGYDRDYALMADLPGLVRQIGARSVWARDVRRDGAVIETDGPVVIDVGAAGKGYLVDIVAGLLRDEGLNEFLVDGSGDLRHAGEMSVRIGLEHPFDPALAIGIARLQGRALCASAVNRRAWGDGLHHVVDARTGRPVRDIVATWVVADCAAVADGLATALFFAPAGALRPTFDFSFVRMFADGRAEISPNFDGELFS